MTLLVAAVSSTTLDEAREDIDAAIEQGANAIELRLDLMEDVTDEDIRTLRRAFPREIPFILTIRSQAEGGEWTGSDEDRIERLAELAPDVADYVDIELAHWRKMGDSRILPAKPESQESGDCQKEACVDDEKPPAIILSKHDTATRPASINKDLLDMLSEPACKIVKLAWRARSIRDNFEAFELMRDAARPVIAICMGDEGIPSRLLAKKFGAFATFGMPAGACTTAPGQISIDQMTQIYRWDAINADTEVYGVIGDPVSQSLSPRLHNAVFRADRRNAVYLPLLVRPSYEAFKAFMLEVLARPWTDFRGFSVTLPHKTNALRFLQERDDAISELAASVGAVNTLVLRPDGSLSGDNTDCPGLLDAIASRPDVTADLKDTWQVCVLGAGGMARAAVAALRQRGASVTICNRSQERADDLAREFGCQTKPWSERTKVRGDVLINATSVGMAPEIDANPMPAEGLKRFGIVFDTVYNPLQTRLLRESDEAGCRTIDGLSLFVSQAVRQQTLWTGYSQAPARFRSILEESLSCH